MTHRYVTQRQLTSEAPQRWGVLDKYDHKTIAWFKTRDAARAAAAQMNQGSAPTQSTPNSSHQQLS